MSLKPTDFDMFGIPYNNSKWSFLRFYSCKFKHSQFYLPSRHVKFRGPSQYRNITGYNILSSDSEWWPQTLTFRKWLILYESPAYIVSMFSDIVQKLWNKLRISTTFFKFFHFFWIEIWITFFGFEFLVKVRLNSDPGQIDIDYLILTNESDSKTSKTKPKPLRIA